jgi:hypothetical protein
MFGTTVTLLSPKRLNASTRIEDDTPATKGAWSCPLLCALRLKKDTPVKGVSKHKHGVFVKKKQQQFLRTDHLEISRPSGH